MSKENALNSIEAVRDFLEKTGELWNQHQHQPSPGSQAEKELSNFPRTESIGTAYSQGSLLIEVAADYINAVIKTITEPAETIAPWACARGVLESSALSMWILDTSVDSFGRVKRSYAFRYEGLDQQRKLAQSTKGTIDPQIINHRIDEVERIALKLGFHKVVDRNGKRVGIGQTMPAITDIVINMLDKEQDYRLLSGMVHAHPWALQNFGFIKAQDNSLIFKNVKGVYFEKHISFDSIFFLCTNCVTSIFQALLMNFNLFGWETEPLAFVVSEAINKIQPPKK